ncbi:hypothetical protein NQ318_011287 [Aromia moschata]|uniref:Polyprenal reductase n=1 Tax=Aromia moschata TaxID=1265417 RepID=A0AAV8X474_9CUCU|nr:hypothetical protein NQ318_011287 [Aromia moschata]
MNYILLGFSFLTTNIILIGSLLNAFENMLPIFLIKMLRYGKFTCKAQLPKMYSTFILEVPKSWFKHFYILAVLTYSYIVYLTISTYIFKKEIPVWFNTLLTLLCGEGRTAATSATKVFIATILMTLQVYRRFYDTQFISVFAKDVKINVALYLMGLYHYAACPLAILCEAPKFAAYSTAPDTIALDSTTYLDIFVIVLFIWAWRHQYITSKILGDLRKNKKGDIVTNDYKLPKGDWFNYLSCPHQTAEVLMYAAVTVLLHKNITWLFVFAWVLTNQVETMLLSHWWYQEAFDQFPKSRKALIPYVKHILYLL